MLFVFKMYTDIFFLVKMMPQDVCVMLFCFCWCY